MYASNRPLLPVDCYCDHQLVTPTCYNVSRARQLGVGGSRERERRASYVQAKRCSEKP